MAISPIHTTKEPGFVVRIGEITAGPQRKVSGAAIRTMIRAEMCEFPGRKPSKRADFLPRCSNRPLGGHSVPSGPFWAPRKKIQTFRGLFPENSHILPLILVRKAAPLTFRCGPAVILPTHLAKVAGPNPRLGLIDTHRILTHRKPLGKFDARQLSPILDSNMALLPNGSVKLPLGHIGRWAARLSEPG